MKKGFFLKSHRCLVNYFMSIRKNLTNVPIPRKREEINIKIENVLKMKLKQQLFA